MGGTFVTASKAVLFSYLRAKLLHNRHGEQNSIVFSFAGQTCCTFVTVSKTVLFPLLRAKVWHIRHCEQNSTMFLLAGQSVAHLSV